MSLEMKAYGECGETACEEGRFAMRATCRQNWLRNVQGLVQMKMRGPLFKLNKNFWMVTAEHQTMPGSFKVLGSVPPRRLHTHEGVTKSSDSEL